MKKEDIILKLKKHTLFHNVDSSALASAISSGDTVVKKFMSGEKIFSPNTHEKLLGFILIGEASVYSAYGESNVLLRSLTVGDAFGISTLFGESDHFISTIIAKKASSVIFFTPSTIENLLGENKEFRNNYIVFLSQRICFLNQKISCFTAGSPEKRLAVFLCSQKSEQSFCVSVNANALSDMLNIGRASLYRAFDKLISEGFIEKDGKNITLTDRNALEKAIAEL